MKSVRLPINRSKPQKTVKFIHFVLLVALMVAFTVSVTATPVLVHACQGIVEDACDTDCCGDQSTPEPCCDEVVSVIRLDCDMVKDANASIPGVCDVIGSVLHTQIVTSFVSHPKVEYARGWRPGPDPTPSRLCVFLI